MVKEKIARICWNSNSWMKPSGSLGKSSKGDTYEVINGYGHEEWLFDFSKIIENYHYGFIQCIGNRKEKLIGQTFNLNLYSINNKTKQWFWIGKIKNVKIVDDNESLKICNIYKKNGWIDQMSNDLRDVKVNPRNFENNYKHKLEYKYGFASLKFKVEDVCLEPEPIQFVNQNHEFVPSAYYNNLHDLKKSPKLIWDFSFKSGHKPIKKRKVVYYDEHHVEAKNDHIDMQNCLYNILAKKYGKLNVATESVINGQSRVDIVVKEKLFYHLFEIKTNPTAKGCIREALGQLLEYAYYDGSIKVKSLTIVSSCLITVESINYLKYLSQRLKITISYKRIDINNEELL